MSRDPWSCRECRTSDGSCRQFVIGHPDPVCVAGYPTPRRRPANPDLFGLDLLVPVPRRSPEDARTR